MEVLSRPKVFSSPPEVIDDEPSPGPSMLAAPSSATRSPPRLPPADQKLTIPARPSITSRRHSTTVGSLSPSHLSRPLRSSPLAGPSIAATNDGSLVAAVSAPSTPGGGFKHLSPLAESSNTISAETAPAVDREIKRQRRRTLGSVLTKLSFPASPAAPSEPASPATPPTSTRVRTKSMTSSQEAPPVPPVPSWAHNTMPARIRPPHASPSSTSPPRAHTVPIVGSPKSARPSSPTPSARSATSSIKHAGEPRRMSFRPPPSTSRSPEDNWLTQSAAPRFSRLGLKAEGVILPVSAKEARRRSTASLASLASNTTRSFDALPPPPVPARTSSRASTASSGSLAASVTRPNTAPASQQHFRSRASSRASLASAASAYGSVYCDTPSLTMSPGPSASDVSLNSQVPTVDEMGVLHSPSHVELQLNDVPVDMLPLPSPSYQGKGKARAVDMVLDAHDAELGVVTPWTRSQASLAPSLTSSAATSVVDLSARGPALRARAATAPELLSGGGSGAREKTKRTHALGRMWKQVVRSVTTRR